MITQDCRSVAEPVHWLGVSCKTILGIDATGGHLSIVDSVSPDRSGPPRDIHRREDETFVILSGQCGFWVEGETFVRGSGVSTFISRGIEHAFRTDGGQPCRHLLALTPGGFEGVFGDRSRGQFRIPEDMPQIEESAARFHLELTGPPLGME